MFNRFINSVFNRGFRKTIILTSHQVYDLFHDFRLGIKTTKRVSGSALGYDGTSRVAYSPSRYYNIFRIINTIKTPTERDTFLDYGCGKGRVLIVASRYPFQKVIGVELNPNLCNIAKQNILRSHKKLVCQNIQIITADAASYLPPADITHFFLYNPFGSDILSQVFDNIYASLVNNPRDITIIYTPPNGNPRTVLDDYSWLHKLGEFPISPRIYHNVVRIYSNK